MRYQYARGRRGSTPTSAQWRRGDAAIQGEGIHSVIDGQRVDWSTGAAQITPATLLHSHHSRGTQRMRSFVIQDEGLHHYTRTPGFSFD